MKKILLIVSIFVFPVFSEEFVSAQAFDAREVFRGTRLFDEHVKEATVDLEWTRHQTKSISYFWMDGKLVGWLQLYAGKTKSQGLPDKFWEDFKKIRDRRQVIESVAFTPDGGWVIIYGRNGHSTYLKDEYKGLKEFLDKTTKKNQPIKSVAVTKDGGWVVLWGRNGYQAEGVPQAMMDRMNQLIREGKSIDRVWFSRNGKGWMIVSNKTNGWHEDMEEDEVLAFLPI